MVKVVQRVEKSFVDRKDPRKYLDLILSRTSPDGLTDPNKIFTQVFFHRIQLYGILAVWSDVYNLLRYVIYLFCPNLLLDKENFLTY